MYIYAVIGQRIMSIAHPKIKSKVRATCIEPIGLEGGTGSTRRFAPRMTRAPIAGAQAHKHNEDAGDDANHTTWSSSWWTFEAQQWLWQPDRSYTGCCDFKGALCR